MSHSLFLVNMEMEIISHFLERFSLEEHKVSACPPGMEKYTMPALYQMGASAAFCLRSWEMDSLLKWVNVQMRTGTFCDM